MCVCVGGAVLLMFRGGEGTSLDSLTPPGPSPSAAEVSHLLLQQRPPALGESSVNRTIGE